MNRQLFAAVAILACTFPAFAYVEAAQSFGAIIQQSTVICTMVVEKVDKANQLIIYRKVADIKGKMETTTIKHNIGKNGLRPGEWQEIMNWAEVGKTAVFFHNGGASETFIGNNWYQAYPNGEWWGMTHAEPFLLRSYCGKADKCALAVKEVLENKEVAVPCMVDGDKELLHKKTAKVQRLKASLKLQDYNPKRDFVSWGGANDEVRKLTGWPGFDKLTGLGKQESEGQSVTALDIDGDGKPDLCLCGANKLTILLQGDDGYSELSLPGFAGGARSACWADYNGDGFPDLLLATPSGPRLYTNLGKAQFRDDTKLLPKETAYNLTAAAWGDFDGDGLPDILLANGFYGLKLYKNARPVDALAKSAPPKLGPWHAVGPFRNMKEPTKNFDTAFDPEKELDKAPDLTKKFKGKRDMEVVWAKKDYEDNGVVSLGEFGGNCATYLYREIEVAAATELPASFGSDDMLTVWMNGEKILSENVSRACAPDSNRAILKLKAGKNRLMLKVCNLENDYAYYFAAGQAAIGGGPWFKDASTEWGLGNEPKGETLAVADFDYDGKLDFLYGSGVGMLFKNTGSKFELKADSVLNFKTAKVGPSLADYDGDGLIDLFIPQLDGGGKLYRNLGGMKFEEATAKAGDLAKPLGIATGAAWGDFDNDGMPDLIVTVLRGPNRYFRNAGKGTFTDETSKLGLQQTIFNSQAAALADMNGDGRLDLILLNEGQDSVVLTGFAPDPAAAKFAVSFKLPKASSLVGGHLEVKNTEGLVLTKIPLFGSDGRGGQSSLLPRVALLPGKYTASCSNGKTIEFAVAKEALKVKFE